MEKEKIDAMLERVKESGYRSSLMLALAEWAEEKLYRLFATRENGMKEFGNPTILTTNLTKEQLYKHLEMYGTTRISSRLNGIFRYGVRNEGKDRREEESELDF